MAEPLTLPLSAPSRSLLAASRVALAPLLLWQGHQVRRNALVLPEASGPRLGLAGARDYGSTMPRLRVLIVGDSSGAGVGAPTQDLALAGQLSQALVRRLQAPVAWQLVARTGWTLSDAIDGLHEMARQGQLPPADLLVTALGVNDAVKQTSPRRWRQQWDALEACARELAGVHQVFVSGVPPMHQFPLLPQPLRWVLGRSARLLDSTLIRWAADSGARAYVGLPFRPGRDLPAQWMAEDGFHPNPAMYQRWGEVLARHIASDYHPIYH